MPVTATLLRKFSQAFGEDVTNELINWFAQVEAAQRSELKELIDRRFDLFEAKFEAKLEQRLAEVKGELRVEIATLRSDMMRWMFIFWAGTVVPLAGLIMALHQR